MKRYRWKKLSGVFAGCLANGLQYDFWAHFMPWLSRSESERRFAKWVKVHSARTSETTQGYRVWLSPID